MADAYPESKAFAPKERSDCRRNKGFALPASRIGLSWVFPMSPGCPRHWCEVLGLGVSRRAHLVQKKCAHLPLLAPVPPAQTSTPSPVHSCVFGCFFIPMPALQITYQIPAN